MLGKLNQNKEDWVEKVVSFEWREATQYGKVEVAPIR